MLKRLLIALVLLPSIGFCQQTIPIQPEETPYLLNKGGFQIENGFAYRNLNLNEKTFVLPTILTKYGLSKKIELRLSLETQLLKKNSETHYRLIPVAVGFKTVMFHEINGLPETALVGQIAVPNWASTNAKLEKWAPEFIIMMQGNYSDFFSMNYNLGLKWDGFDDKPFYTYKFTANATNGKKWSIYSEILGALHTLEKPEASLNNGIMYLISNDMILDTSAGFGFNEQSPEWFCAIVYSIRF